MALGKNAHRRVRPNGIAEQARDGYSHAGIVPRFVKLATISDQFSDGIAVATLPVGNYTYKNQAISLVSSVEIDGVTINDNGTHYVKTANIPDYIEELTLEIDSEPVRKHLMTELIDLNGFFGHDRTDGVVWMSHAGPNFFNDLRYEDAYCLGTADLDQLRINFKLTPAFVNGTMRIELNSEHFRVGRPLHYFETYAMRRHTAASVGEHTIEVDTHSDLSRIYIKGAGLVRAQLVVDEQVVTDGTNLAVRSLNDLYGRDVTSLDDGFMFDFQRNKDGDKALRSLEDAAQRRRNAKILVIVETSNPTTEIFVYTSKVGKYSQQ